MKKLTIQVFAMVGIVGIGALLMGAGSPVSAESSEQTGPTRAKANQVEMKAPAFDYQHNVDEADDSDSAPLRVAPAESISTKQPAEYQPAPDIVNAESRFEAHQRDRQRFGHAEKILLRAIEKADYKTESPKMLIAAVAFLKGEAETNRKVKENLTVSFLAGELVKLSGVVRHRYQLTLKDPKKMDALIKLTVKSAESETLVSMKQYREMMTYFLEAYGFGKKTTNFLLNKWTGRIPVLFKRWKGEDGLKEISADLGIFVLERVAAEKYAANIIEESKRPPIKAGKTTSLWF